MEARTCEGREESERYIRRCRGFIASHLLICTLVSFRMAGYDPVMEARQDNADEAAKRSQAETRARAQAQKDKTGGSNDKKTKTTKKTKSSKDNTK